MQTQTKEKLKALVEKYEKVKTSGKLKFYTEEEAKKDFILPLFEILGWDVYGRTEVSAEETISSERVDYGFYLDDRIKFYLEAKKFSVDIHDEKFANQAIRYSFNKGATWAVLTNFTTLIVFNAQHINGMLHDKRFFEMTYSQYLERIDQLELLSKKAFKENLLDKEAEKVGKKIQKVSVSSLLYKDLQLCRDILTKDLNQWNEKVDPDLLDEGVQKLLDRLIFIRVAEDRGIEPPILIPMVRQARDAKGGELYQAMSQKFREFDHFYNSNLFSPHPFEKWEEYSGATEKVIKILYGKEGYYEYDFKIMSADVLGTVYENYLSHRLLKSKKGTTVLDDAKKRKEQGIYYTPNYIVDYIVKNTLDPVLNKCKSIEDIKRIKVLDPACGSGSFLIKAAEIIFNRYIEIGFKGKKDLLKIQILKENIYGVDLDPQAVEITRLNLLINALFEREKLPFLHNIKNGNSLIYGTDEELKKYFGKDFKEKKPFNWQEEFSEVFKQGGFDIIIGNPPWGAEIEELDKKYYKNLFQSSTGIIDTFSLFIEKSFSLLKESGCLGFVLPDIVLLKNYPQIRKLILDKSIISKVYYTGMAFQGVNLDSVIMVFKVEKDGLKRNKNIIDVIVNDEHKKIEQRLFYENKDYKFNLYFDKQNIDLKKKLDSSSIKLGELLEIHEGIHSGNIREKLFIDPPISKNCKKLLFKGTEINRYSEKWNGKYVNYNKDIIKKDKNEYANLGKEEYFVDEKILVRRTGDRILATIDNDKYFASNNFFVLYNKEKSCLNLNYILAILNSKIGTWYFLTIQPRKGKLFAEIKINHLAEIPIFKINFSNKEEGIRYNELVKLVDKMIKLNKELQGIIENSEKWNSIKAEIEKTDKKIDEGVYKLYNLSQGEIRTIESLNEK